MLVATLVLSDGIGAYAYSMEGKSSNSPRVNVETANSDLMDNHNSIPENVEIKKALVETQYSETAKTETVSVETANVESVPVESASVEKKKHKYDAKKSDSDARRDRSGAAGIKDIIIETLDGAKKDAKNKHKDCYSKSVLKCEKSTKWILNTRNIKQSYCNLIYSIDQKLDYIPSGTCVQVAGASMTEYFTRKGFSKTYEGAKYIYAFSEMLLRTMMDNQITFVKGKNGVESSGTHPHYFPYMYEYFYLRHNKKTKGYLWDHDYESVKNLNKLSRPVHGTFYAPNKDGHSMVINGAYEITIEYKEKKKDKSKTKTYVYYTVNDGYKDSTKGDGRVQYVQRKYCGNITTLSYRRET